jgi:hypothetical protein
MAEKFCKQYCKVKKEVILAFFANFEAKRAKNGSQKRLFMWIRINYIFLSFSLFNSRTAYSDKRVIFTKYFSSFCLHVDKRQYFQILFRTSKLLNHFTLLHIDFQLWYEPRALYFKMSEKGNTFQI